MVYLMVLWITSLTMGLSLMDQNDQSQRSWPGLFFLMGFYLLIVSLFSANVIFHIPLNLSAKIILSVALGWFIYSKHQLFRSRDFWLSLLCHPVLLYFIIFLSAILLFDLPSYKINKTDEYSYWLFMTKKIIFLDQINDPNFPFQNFYNYTPGWPLLLAYPQLLLSQFFDAGPMIYAAWFTGFALCCFIFDLLVHALPQLGNINKKLIAWLGLLLLCFMRVFGPIFPTDVLVEPPVAHALISTLLLVFILTKNYLGPKKVLGMLSLNLIAGYLIKTPYSAVILPAVVISLVWIYKNSKGEKNLPTLKFMVTQGLRLLGPLIVIALAWKYYIREIAVQIPINTLSLEQIFPARNYVFPRMFDSLLSFFKKTRYVMGLPGIVLGLFFTRHRLLSIASIAFYLIFMAGLAWVYLSLFGDYESGKLASFSRYNRMAIWVLTLIGLFISLELLLNLKPVQWLFSSKSTKHFMALLLFVSGFVLCFKLYSKARKSFREIADLKSSSVLDEAQLFKQQLDQKIFAKPPYGFMISQEEKWGEVSEAWFASFDRHKIYYELPSKYTWDDKTSAKAIVEHLRERAEFLWPLKSNALMDKALKVLTKPYKCPPPYTQYFLWREELKPVSFSCSLKGSVVKNQE